MCQLPNVRYLSQLLPCGEKVSIKDTFKSMSGPGQKWRLQGRNLACHLIRKASVKGIWFKELLSNLPCAIWGPSLDRWTFLVLNQAWTWTIVSPTQLWLLLAETVFTPILFFPSVLSPRYFSVDILVKNLELFPRLSLLCHFLFLWKYQWNPMLSSYMAASFHVKEPWTPAVISGSFLSIFHLKVCLNQEPYFHVSRMTQAWIASWVHQWSCSLSLPTWISRLR